MTKKFVAGLADLIAIVPALVGFHPVESVVLVFERDGRVVFTSRHDTGTHATMSVINRTTEHDPRMRLAMAVIYSTNLVTATAEAVEAVEAVEVAGASPAPVVWAQPTGWQAWSGGQFGDPADYATTPDEIAAALGQPHASRSEAFTSRTGCRSEQVLDWRAGDPIGPTEATAALLDYWADGGLPERERLTMLARFVIASARNRDHLLRAGCCKPLLLEQLATAILTRVDEPAARIPWLDILAVASYLTGSSSYQQVEAELADQPTVWLTLTRAARTAGLPAHHLTTLLDTH